MATRLSVYLLTLLCLIPSVVQAKQTGALVQACQSMTPNHYGTTAQTTAAPFSLTVDKTIYEEGDTITVTLTKTSANQFKGYFIQARDRNQDIIPGFSVSHEGKLLACESSTGAVTHTEASLKDSVSFQFSAPDPSYGNLTMYATVVQSFNTYWVKIPSQTIVSVSGESRIIFSIPLLVTIFLLSRL